MDKLKIRKILLIVLFVIIAISITLGAIYQLKLNKYYDYLNSGQAIKIKSSEWTIIMGVVLGVIFGLFAWAFAMVYTFSNKNQSKLNRKWPYIVMIVFAAILLIVFIASTLWSKKLSGYVLSDQNKKDLKDLGKDEKVVQADFRKYYEDNFGYLQYLTYTKAAINATIIALSSWIIVLIKQSKNDSDVSFSKNVLNDGRAINQANQNRPAPDLP